MKGSKLALLILIAAGAGSGFYLTTRTGDRKAAGQAEAVSVRTATVRFGDLRKTVRITGTIGAERFAALMAPRLRGSRSDRGRGGSSSSSSSSTSSSSTSSTAASSSAATSTSGTSTTSTTSSIGAQRGTTNRFNDAATNAATRTATSTTTQSSSTTSTADLGSTAGSLLSSSTSSSHDFELVLVNVAAPGAHVKKGDVVAEFDRQYMLLRLDDYKDSVAQLTANLKKLKADLAVAKEVHDQQVHSAQAAFDKAELDLKTIAVRSAIESEEFKLNAEQARAYNRQMQQEVKLFDESQRAQIRDAELELEQAVIELKRAEANVERMVLRAPLNGVVVMQTLFRGGQFGQVQKGDQVWPGMHFMSIVDPSSMVVNAAINQVDSDLLRLGMQANVRLDAYPDVRLPATVVGIGAMTKPGGWRASYFREVPVRLELDQIDPRVLPDLTASATITLQTEAGAAIVPLEAIFHDGDAARPFVFLRSPTGWMRRDVEVGLANELAVAVRAGLQKGDVIAAQRPL
jgi:HlyD family secretion protein